PLRGGTDSAELAERAAEASPVRFSRAVRILFTVRTLKRIYIAYIFVGAAFIPLTTFYTLYLDRQFHIGPFGRGVVGGFNAGAANSGIAGAISDAHGLRVAIASLTPYWLIAGYLVWSAWRFVEADTNRALANLYTASRLQQEWQQADGEQHMLVVRNLEVHY